MIVAQIGNFDPLYSTENELKRALESLGHSVVSLQENDSDSFLDAIRVAPDFILWTHTQFGGMRYDRQWQMLATARQYGIPVIGLHLDRWFGLSREHLLDTEPFFQVDTLYTADGGPHDWESKGINHRWLPPAVDEASCYRGEPRAEYRSEIAFIGNWNGSYHKEHTHRHQLVQWLRDTYGERVRFWPQDGQPAIRGNDLNDLIASCDVIVGDSCFVGTDHYWSDRIPETLGRGGYLIHPRIDGLSETYETGGLLMPDIWDPFNWNQLEERIEFAFDRPGIRESGRHHQIEYIKAAHTYKHRMQEVIDNLERETNE